MTKWCPMCLETKNIKDFHKNRTKKDGFQTYCKECVRTSYKYYRPGRGNGDVTGHDGEPISRHLAPHYSEYRGG